MAMTASDVLRNADTFRAAYPSWPHAEPERPAPLRPSGMSLGEQRARIRAILAGQAVPPLAGAPRIEVLEPDETEADEMHRLERADCEGGW